MRKCGPVLLLVLQGAAACAAHLSISVGPELLVSSMSFVEQYSGGTSTMTSESQIAGTLLADLSWGEILGVYAIRTTGTQSTTGSSSAHSFSVSLTSLGVGGCLKTPIRVGPALVYPLLGAQWSLVMAYADGKTDLLGLTSSGGQYVISPVWLLLGAGADLPLFDLLRLRVEVAYSLNTLLLPGSQQSTTTQSGSLTAGTPGSGLLVRVMSTWQLR